MIDLVIRKIDPLGCSAEPSPTVCLRGPTPGISCGSQATRRSVAPSSAPSLLAGPRHRHLPVFLLPELPELWTEALSTWIRILTALCDLGQVT